MSAFTLLAAACATATPAARIAAATPGAAYEATLTGCGLGGGPTARHFGRDLRSAILWARQATRSPSARPCVAVIEAVGGAGGRRTVYRVDDAGRETVLPR